MVNRTLKLGIVTAVLAAAAGMSTRAEAAPPGQPSDWQRFYYYPYVYYPQNFQQPQSYNHLYHRYPQQRQIPVYNSSWHNFYPEKKPYHYGHHYTLDVF
jgi:hypothetical protein